MHPGAVDVGKGMQLAIVNVQLPATRLHHNVLCGARTPARLATNKRRRRENDCPS